LNNYGTKYINSDWRILWNFINGQIATGKYSSVKVVRTALRHFEEEENQKKSLINELEIGEKAEKLKFWQKWKLSDAE
jgi:putative addiction module CopG family antidote